MSKVIPISPEAVPEKNGSDLLARLEKLEDSFLLTLQEIRAIRLELATQKEPRAGLEKLLDANDVAALLGETERWVYRQAKTKKIPSIKLGKYWKFSPVQLQKWLDRKQTP